MKDIMLALCLLVIMNVFKGAMDGCERAMDDFQDQGEFKKSMWFGYVGFGFGVIAVASMFAASYLILKAILSMP